MTTDSNDKFLLRMEENFKRTCKLTQDISKFPLSNNVSLVETNKAKSKEFSEVFTPLWLVDQMITQANFKSCNVQTLDLCAGYGQFSIRLMRHFNTFPDWDLKRFIKDNHAFSELQLSSCYKLLNIFSTAITLFIGDSMQLNKLPANAKGLWCYIESYGYWVCLTQTIKKILSPNGTKEKAISENQFVSSMELLIKGLNETYSNMKEKYSITASQLTPKLRLNIIDQLNSIIKNDKGETIVKVIPSHLVSEMVDQVEDLEKKSILVLYNCEIIEYLITKKKIDPKNITFGTDFNGAVKSDIMKKMYGVETINFSSDVAFMHSAFKGRKFDVCLTNPPYNDHFHLKILMALISNTISKEYVIVHPANWIIDQKESLQLFYNFKALVSKTLKSVNLFNGNTVFGIDLFYPCVITHIGSDNSGKIKVKYFDDTYNVSDIRKITKYGKSWETIVSPLVAKLNKTIQINGSVWDKNIKQITPNLEYCQLAALRGNHGKDPSAIIKDDFYTMIQKDHNADKGIRKSMDKRPGPTFEFSTVLERDNFINYLKTDFARFCLSIYKIGANLFYGEMDMIPWLDFTQAWDDDKLFNHFDINKDTQNYIRKFLPDYYGIRK